MDLIKSLKLADYSTILALILSLVANYLLLFGSIFWAINLWILAFIFDLLDGYIARKTKASTLFGATLDSHADVFIYLVFGSILYIKYLAPSLEYGLVAGMLVLLFGVLRLVRHSIRDVSNDIPSAGSLSAKLSKRDSALPSSKDSSYLGVPVFIPFLAILLGYFFSIFIDFRIAQLCLALVIPLLSVLMISNVRVKNKKGKNVLILIFMIFLLNILTLFL